MAVHITRAGVAVTVGIIILTGLMIGGLLWVKHTGDVARHDQAISIAQQNLEKDSNQKIVLNDGSSSKDNNQQSQQQSSGSSSTGSTSTGSTSQNSSAGELPQTGPRDNFTFVMLGVLVFMGVSYIQSRRTLRNTR